MNWSDSLKLAHAADGCAEEEESQPIATLKKTRKSGEGGKTARQSLETPQKRDSDVQAGAARR